MLVELVTVRTHDEVDLDGALYAVPTSVKRKGACLVLHGLTWNFYQGPTRWLPPLAAQGGYDCLSLNFRDHDTRDDPQNLEEGLELSHRDIRAGIEYLYSRGADDVVILGHGYANNKIACYPALSGDRRARRFVMATLGAIYGRRPDVWKRVCEMATQLEGEVLVIQGALDTMIDARLRADEFVAAAHEARIETILLEGANHYFDSRHEALWDCIAGWLATPNNQ